MELIETQSEVKTKTHLSEFRNMYKKDVTKENHINDDHLLELMINSNNAVIRDKTFYIKENHTVKNDVYIEKCIFYLAYGCHIFFDFNSNSKIINNYFCGASPFSEELINTFNNE